MNSPLPAADEPLLIISGLPSSETLPGWVQAWSNAGVAQWVAPQALLGPRGAALADNHARIVWLYRAPWGSVGPAGMRLGSWLSLQRQALRQRGQNPGAWVLVNADLLDPEALADHLGLWVDAPVEDSAATAPSTEAAQRQLLWARLFEWAAPQAWDMYEALEAATWAAPGQPAPMLREELPAPEPAAVEALLRQLQEADGYQAQAQRWQARATELEAAEQALRQEAELQLEQAQEDLAVLTAQRDEALVAVEAARQEADRQLEEARAEASSQIAQVQDALEHVKDALEQARLELSARTAESEQAQAEAARQLADAQALTSQRETQLKEAQEEGELLLLQLHQVQEELEQLFLQGKEKDATAAQTVAEAQAAHQQTQAALERSRGEAQQHRSEAQQLQSEVLQARSTLEQAHRELNARSAERDQAQAALRQSQGIAAQHETQLRESQEEGELLLLQLHQVQEELETYFLRGKELEQQLQAVRSRYERLQRRHPQAVDVDGVDVTGVEASADVPMVAWHMAGLAVAGHVWPELTLRATLQATGVGLQLEGPAGSPLAGCMDGPLIPKALAARQPAQIERFRALGSQAWRTLAAAAAAVDESLASPGTLGQAPTDFDATFWRQSFGAMAPVLRALPPVFRYDTVRLKREKVNPDYEHLWLAFEGASYGAQEMPGFEMRLGAAQTQPSGFSHLPKLEFPRRADGKPPFEGWFEESHDDFGPKFELRADLKREMFDLGVWARVPKTTQAMLLSLIAAQPSILEAIEHQGSRLSRPWSDWKQLTARLIEVIRLRLAPPKPTPLPTMPPEPTAVPGQAAGTRQPTGSPAVTAVAPRPRRTSQVSAGAPAGRKKPAGKSAKAASK